MMSCRRPARTDIYDRIVAAVEDVERACTSQVLVNGFQTTAQTQTIYRPHLYSMRPSTMQVPKPQHVAVDNSFLCVTEK